MYSTCIFCNGSLESNEVIEVFPVGRRLAFDSQRGRLWVICRSCEKWNLTPFDQRWEAIETCEELFRRERKKSASGNIGLAQMDNGLELVRIGRPGRDEFASWRYGDQFGRRRRRAVSQGILITAVAGFAAAGALAVGATAGLGGVAYYLAEHRVRKSRLRDTIASIATNEGETVTVLREHLPDLRLKTDYETPARWKLVLPHTEGSTTVSAEHAVLALAQLLPIINGRGASEARVRRAIRRLEGMHDPQDYMRSAASVSSHDSRPGRQGAIRALPMDMRLAIEMAANEENERLALAGEMWLLEWAWEQAEIIAAIADRLEIPQHIEQRFRELKARASRTP